MHCCPPTLPVCDTAGGRCLPKRNGADALLRPQPWLERTPAKRDYGALARLWMRKAGWAAAAGQGGAGAAAAAQ